jgi:hypothetical protein
MAILDETNEFADRLSLALGGPTTNNVGDAIDIHRATTDPNTLRELGAVEAPYLVIVMTTSATSSGNAVLQFRLVSDDTAATSLTTATVHATSAPWPTALLTKGRPVMVQRLPAGPYERFLRIQQITTEAVITGGAFSAYLTDDPSIFRLYVDGVL